MSDYRAPAYNPESGRVEEADWIDNHFGHHIYGVKFGDGQVWHVANVNIEAASDEIQNLRRELKGARVLVEGASSRPKNFLAWAVKTFGPVAKLRSERLMRFVEEAIELAHADNMELETLHAIIRRVYTRQPGLIAKEIGQAQVTLEMYSENFGFVSADLADEEWRRVQEIPQSEWERRHAAKQAIGIAHPSTELQP
jgi:hypothetical protein